MPRIEQFAIAMLIFSVVMVASTLLISDFSDKYDEVDLSTGKFNESFDHISTMYDDGKDTEEDIRGEDISEDATEDSIFKAGFKTARRVFLSIFVIPGEIIGGIVGGMDGGVAPFFVDAAMAALFIILSFAIVYLVFRMVVK